MDINQASIRSNSFSEKINFKVQKNTGYTTDQDSDDSMGKNWEFSKHLNLTQQNDEKQANSEVYSNFYEQMYSEATDPNTRELFWFRQSKKIHFLKQPQKILDSSNPPYYKWFPDSRLNMSQNCIDRHAEKFPNQPALIWQSNMVNQTRTYTFKELQVEVQKCSRVLSNLGIKLGDRVIIFCPMIPEALICAQAIVRIGAVHSIVFGGFAAKELANRILDCQPKLIISASCGIEPHKIVDYKQLLNEALEIAQMPKLKTMVIQRKELYTSKILIGRDLDYHSMMAVAKPLKKVQAVKGNHPLYILYTSGTTGTPKGIVRDTAGTAVALSWTMEHIMGIKENDVFFCTNDIGWVVGHQFLVYGPLLVGATTVMYEGKPIGTPNPGALWQIVEKYKAKGLYTAPTAVRALKQEDPSGQFIKQYDVSSLKIIALAGERCDVLTFGWLETNFPNALINDNYWQTESGWIISCNYANLHTFKNKPGSAIKPAPGFAVQIMNEKNKVITERKKLGKIVIRLPLPPSFMLTIWGNDQAFVQKYLSEVPGYYTTGDAGYFDDEGYLNIMTRLDDVINVAGHRLSTYQMEEVLMMHKSISEGAVVSIKDTFRGEAPIGFVVLNYNTTIDQKSLLKEVVILMRQEIGPVAGFKDVIIIKKLPKTRSGKVLRYVLKKMLDGDNYQIPATIEDYTVLYEIEAQVKLAGYGKQVDIDFGDEKAINFSEQHETLVQEQEEEKSDNEDNQSNEENEQQQQ